jgi:hypothetical protein
MAGKCHGKRTKGSFFRGTNKEKVETGAELRLDQA